MLEYQQFLSAVGRHIDVSDTEEVKAGVQAVFGAVDQVRVSAERPGLAARPGHSNHGWGTAADLCGGIDRFGTPTHDWMLANAPLFGWFHPAWAEPSGKLPEPWHWEFGG